MPSSLSRRRLALAVAALAAAGARPARASAARPPGGPADLAPGYADVDPRTARRVPLTLSLRTGVPLYPGDPPFRYEVATDTRTAAHDDGGYLLEHITSLGTHTASHISAPAHFVEGARDLAQLDERWTLMPLAVLDVRGRLARGESDRLTPEGLRAWERRHGRFPSGGCVLLLTGNGALWALGQGASSPYVTTPVPGLSGDAVDWLVERRGVLATGSDSLGPEATSDTRLQATTRTLVHGGVTLENVGPGLARVRPHGDWIAVNANRPAMSGFQAGFTGFTVPGPATPDQRPATSGPGPAAPD